MSFHSPWLKRQRPLRPSAIPNRQRIPKIMNNSITDNGTPNNHIIIIRVMNPPFRLLLLENGYDVRVVSFLQQTPIHSAASMPLRRQNKFDVDSALYGLFPEAGRRQR
jgi:hypothetical protein